MHGASCIKIIRLFTPGFEAMNLGRWYPQGKPAAAHYYRCHACGSVDFVLADLNCPKCGYPFINYDRKMRRMYNQSSLEEVGVIPMPTRKAAS